MSDSVEKDPHNRAAKHDDDEDDPVDKMLKKAGCLEKHYKVQECMVEHKDWRQCKAEVKGIDTLIQLILVPYKLLFNNVFAKIDIVHHLLF